MRPSGSIFVVLILQACADFISPVSSKLTIVTSVVEGSSKLLKPKEDATLTCNVKTGIPIKIEGVTLVWTRHGEVVKSVKDKYDFEGNESSSQLTVHVVDMNDVGPYSCEASSKEGKDEREFYIYAHPFFHRSDSSATASVNTTATLQMTVWGYPPPETTWQASDDSRFQDARLPSPHPFEFFARLTIKSAMKKDSGVYVCEAANKLGSARRKILLRINNFDDSKLPIIVCCVEIAFVIVVISIPELIKLCHRIVTERNVEPLSTQLPASNPS